ncbi:ATP-binding cassette domain-containing protein [Phaeobacter sp. HS012]|uniref:ABC transporter ATP-binding protein n=1 Tax=Phaeobacter inhibens TaxID=221822 RepID=A0A2I7KC29_9RHOB|nr:ATP-binding cassette domain-containing protein [Phaeobacter inhibens]MBQ4809098.1 ATP-binding cassette domain-containing protein [Phaeobacter sp. HS012]MBQ4883925.1 ATP-binding cassette domain-containing protein [Phaeobacter sp. HS011]AUR00162.1 ABC transporter ATP-binding protein [Phaeobacter inhibens]UWR63814.1 ATP-binding cassette domain-containing protein [Phaeobacter inhibens]UWR99413.1 ATP-binding cassette domain-containing protein [Phaeobacter inhibens]
MTGANTLFPLVVEAAQVRRRGKTLIGPVDLRLDGQGTTIVIGPNGSGKTSLLKMLHGILRLGQGRITWGCAMAESQRRQAFVFQTPVMMRRSVVENIAYPLRLNRVPRKVALAEAEIWAERIGLGGDALQRPAVLLSGGERQKLALARALIRKPQLLFLDEPCASLDGRATREIEEILTEAAASGTRLIMSTHNMGQAQRLADEVLFVLHGQIAEFSAAEAFFTRPHTEQGRAFLRGDIVE